MGILRQVREQRQRELTAEFMDSFQNPPVRAADGRPLVVLGGDDGQRAAFALDSRLADRAREVWVTEGHPAPREAAQRVFRRRSGLRVRYETQAKHTRGNAHYMWQALRGEPRITLITNRFHMRRALMLFKLKGFDPLPFVCDMPWEGRDRIPHEARAYIDDRARARRGNWT